MCSSWIQICFFSELFFSLFFSKFLIAKRNGIWKLCAEILCGNFVWNLSRNILCGNRLRKKTEQNLSVLRGNWLRGIYCGIKFVLKNKCHLLTLVSVNGFGLGFICDRLWIFYSFGMRSDIQKFSVYLLASVSKNATVR